MSDLSLTDGEFERLRVLLERWCGILVGKDKSYLIETRLGPLAKELGCHSYSEFYQLISGPSGMPHRDRVIDLMTTNETLWFRDSHPYTIMREKLFPEYAREIREGKRLNIRVWSAACSTGQEPFSTVMVLNDVRQMWPDIGRATVEILATDISTNALRLASLGRYDQIAISRGLPDSYRDRYFKNEGRVWALAPEVKQAVKLKKFNLQDDFGPLGRFDIVLCRNVAIYFNDDFKRDLFARIARTLNPGGIFFLGASESLSAYSTEFHMLTHGPGVYYKVKDNLAPKGFLK